MPSSRLDDVLLKPTARRRRAPWRQKLVDAERGLTLGFRSDSALFVHLFVDSLVVAGGVVLGLSLIQWTLLTLAVALALTAEMFHQGLKALLGGDHGHDDDPPPHVLKALRMSTAAVMVAIFGALTTTSLLFGARLNQLLGG